MRHSCQKTCKSTVKNGQQAEQSHRSSFSFKNHKVSQGTLMAQSLKTSQGGASLARKVQLPSMKTVQPIRSQPPAWQWRWKQSSMPSAGLPQEVTVILHMPSSSRIEWACYKKWKVEWEAQTGMCWWCHPPSKTPVGVRPWTCQNERKWLSR